LGLTAFNLPQLRKLRKSSCQKLLGPTTATAALWHRRLSTEKVTYFPRVRLAFFSNRCLNSSRPFKTGVGNGKAFAHGGTGRIGLTGFVMASQWGYAAEPPAYPVPQIVRDEHDLVADMIKAQLAVERDRYAEQRTAIGVTPSAVGPASVPRAPSSVRGRRNS
jgi:hypothetical protein